MAGFNEETVLSVHHWTDTLFSFTTTRETGFRFDNGQFAMIGLKVGGKPLVRAYSMVSPNHEDGLEFLSIKVQDGPLTSRLQHVVPGDRILVGSKVTGTLVLDNLLPGKTLYLLCTGTGLAPFMSLIRDPEVYERFERVVLLHGCRKINELAYNAMIDEALPNDEYLGEMIQDKLFYIPSVTREPFKHRGRIGDLLQSTDFLAGYGLAPLSPVSDRVMLCGSPAMLQTLTAMLRDKGFVEGSSSEPGQFVVEKAFVER